MLLRHFKTLIRTFTAEAMLKYRPIVISGPSGSGKSTLLQKLFKDYPGCFEFSISHTTRKPREGETEGKDYYYVDRSVFEKMIEEGGFLEHAQFSGNRYGTSKMAVEKVQASGRICILDVEVNGVKSIKKTDLNARYIFVQPPSMEELEKRLRSRGSETEESLKKRLDSCQEAFDYSKEPGSYDHIIVNDNLDIAYEKLKGILSTCLTEKNAEEAQDQSEEKKNLPDEIQDMTEEKQIQPEEKQIQPEEKQIQPEEKQIQPEEKQIQPEEKLIQPEEKLIQLEVKQNLFEEEQHLQEEKNNLPKEKQQHLEEKQNFLEGALDLPEAEQDQSDNEQIPEQEQASPGGKQQLLEGQDLLEEGELLSDEDEDPPDAFDSHFHLDRTSNRAKRGLDEFPEVCQSICPDEEFRVNISGGVAVFCDPATYPKEALVQYCQEQGLVVAVGLHPKTKSSAIDWEAFEECLKIPGVTAFGEVGLDYSVPAYLWSEQHLMLDKALEYLRSDMVLILHSRCHPEQQDNNATQLFYQLKGVVQKEQKIHLHCFSGDQAGVDLWLKEFPNTHFGFTAMVRCFSEPSKWALKSLSEDKLLLETDAPYFRIKGRRFSTPAMLGTVASLVGAIRGEDWKEVLKVASCNARRLYGINPLNDEQVMIDQPSIDQ